MASSDIECEDLICTTLELIHDTIAIFEPELCLTQENFWKQLPRTIDEVIQIPPELEAEWDCLKMFYKRLANYFQNHKENSYLPSLIDVLQPLKTVMGAGFKMSFSAKLRDMLKNWFAKSKDMLGAMDGLSSSLHPTTRTSTSTTTVLTQEDHVDAFGEKKQRKRKIVNLEDAFSDLVDDDELEISNYPTGSVSSYISQRKGDELQHRILTDK